MQKFVALLFLAFVAQTYADCTATTDNCQTCTSNNYYSCGGSLFGSPISCVRPADVPDSGVNGLCNLNVNTYYCAGGTVNATTGPSWSTLYNSTYQNVQYTNCLTNNNTNSDCCSSSPACPVTCSSQPVGGQTQTYTQNNIDLGHLLCYSYCTSCSGLGRSEGFCQNNCGSGGGYGYACQTGADADVCCDLFGSASVMSSWLSYLF